MKVDEMDKMVLDYLYGELPPEKRQKFEAQMAKDARLRTEVAEYQELLSQYREIEKENPLPDLPSSISHRILAASQLEALRLRDEKNRRFHWAGFFQALLRPSLAFVFAVFLIAAASFQIGRYQAQQEGRLKDKGSLISMKETIDAMNKPEAEFPNQTAAQKIPPVGLSANPGSADPSQDPSISMEESVSREIATLSPPLPASEANGEIASAQEVNEPMQAPEVEKPFGFAPAEDPTGDLTLVSQTPATDRSTQVFFRTFSPANSVNPEANPEDQDLVEEDQSLQAPQFIFVSRGPASPETFSPHPGSVGEQLHSAQIHTQKQNWVQALRHYQTVTNLAPQSFESMMAYHQSARIYVKMGYLSKANYLYEILLNRFPQYRYNDQVLLETGRLYAKQGNWSKSKEHLQKLFDTYPQMRNQVSPHLYYVNQHLDTSGQTSDHD